MAITITQAKALADQWQAQREDAERQPYAGYFSDASAHDLIEMLETGKGPNGRKLNNWEFACFVERWVEVFGDFPAGRDDDVANPVALPERSEPTPADDTMLRLPDVERMTGISKSTINRMSADGRFPKPMRLSERAKGWPAREIKAWIETLDEQRRRPRQ